MTTPTLPNKVYRGNLRERFAHRVEIIRRWLVFLFVSVMAYVVAPVFRWRFARKQAAGETIWLDDLTFGKKDSPAHNPPADKAADIAPNTHLRSRQSRVIKHDGYPEPDYGFAYRNPPLSGNVISGLSEQAYRRASKVFHTIDYAGPWGGLEFYFHQVNSAEASVKASRTVRKSHNADGPVHPVQQPVDDPAAMSAAIKAAALEAGAALVGITAVHDHHIYDDSAVNYRYAISIAATMDREAMLMAPLEDAVQAVMDGYLDVGEIALTLGQRIRAMGWKAKGIGTITTGEVIHLPIAIDAGLGELGKHGSLITKEYGSNVRLSTVLTDLPLAVDEPVDIGVDDFCLSCQVCTTNCPPQAIFETKQTVRGEEKWFVDFDKCVPYFSEHGGCGICIEVCPWSEPGRGPIISEKMLSRREPVAA